MEGNTGVLSMVTVGRSPYDSQLRISDPFTRLSWGKNAISISHKETQHTHAHTHTPFYFLILCDLLLVLGWPMEDIFRT